MTSPFQTNPTWGASEVLLWLREQLADETFLDMHTMQQAVHVGGLAVLEYLQGHLTPAQGLHPASSTWSPRWIPGATGLWQRCDHETVLKVCVGGRARHHHQIHVNEVVRDFRMQLLATNPRPAPWYLGLRHWFQGVHAQHLPHPAGEEPVLGCLGALPAHVIHTRLYRSPSLVVPYGGPSPTLTELHPDNELLIFVGPPALVPY